MLSLIANWSKRVLPFLVWCVAVTFWAAPALALEVPPLDGRINDHANLLSAEAKQSLTGTLVNYENVTGHQLAILTIPTLAGDPLEDFSVRVVEKWKLGKKGKDDGILLLVVANDHKMRIEVGYGLEGDLPDALAGRIVRDVMAPRFRQGNFAGGIEAATREIIAKTGGGTVTPGGASTTEPVPTQNSPSSRPSPLGRLGIIGLILGVIFKFAFFGLFVVIVIIIAIVNMFGGGRSGGMFRGGGGSFGGGSGGFGGGGGSFGGGGASGNW